MPRKIVLSICVFNLLIVFAAIGYYFASKSDKGLFEFPMADRSEPIELSKEELLYHAQQADHPSIAANYLSRIDDTDVVMLEAQKLIQRESFSNPQNWPYEQALLSFLTTQTSSMEGLNELERLFSKSDIPLTIRSHILVLYVESCLRLGSPEASYPIIDFAFEERNSLRGLSLNADQFLLNKDVHNAERKEQLIARCLSVLVSKDSTENNQFAAIQILHAHSTVDRDWPTKEIFEMAQSERVQNICLKIAGRTTLSADHWMKHILPGSPEQERILMELLGSHTDAK